MMSYEKYKERAERIRRYKGGKELIDFTSNVYGKFIDKVISVNVSGTHPLLGTGGLYPLSDIDINFVLRDSTFKDDDFVRKLAEYIEHTNHDTNKNHRKLKSWLINSDGYSDPDKLLLNKRTLSVSAGVSNNNHKGNYSNAKNIFLDFMKVTGVTLVGYPYIEEASIEHLPRSEARGLAEVAYYRDMQKTKEEGYIPTYIWDAAKAVLKSAMADAMHKNNGFEPLYKIQQVRHTDNLNYYSLLYEALGEYNMNDGIVELSRSIRERRKTNLGMHQLAFLFGAYRFVEKKSEELGVIDKRQPSILAFFRGRRQS